MPESTVTASGSMVIGRGSRAVDALLVYQKAGFYGCLPDPDVTWEANGDAPPAGYIPSPTSGPVLYTDGPDPGGQCKYHGFLITAPMTVTIDSLGRFGGVAGGGGAWIQVTLWASGRLLDTFYAADPNPGFHNWSGFATFYLEDVVLYAGEELYQECIFGGWAGFEYYSQIPGEMYPYSHFRITGNSTGGPSLRMRGSGSVAGGG